MPSTSRRIRGRDRLVILATGIEVTTETGTPVYVAVPVATQLAIITQPAGAVDGVVLSAQPVIELRSATNQPVLQAGVTITASIVAGAGSITAGVSAVTAANGRATFVGLTIDAAAPPASFTLRFNVTAGATGVASVDSNSFTVGATVVNYYATAFSATENPISEAGRWQHLDETLTPCKTVGGHAVGTQTGNDNLDDSTAYIPGFGTDYGLEAIIWRDPAATADINREVELWARMSDDGPLYDPGLGPTHTRGYEVNVNHGGVGGVGRFKGAALDSWTAPATPVSGDRFALHIDGQTMRIYWNESLRLTVTDNDPTLKVTTGNPGIGFFIRAPAGNTDYGFDSLIISAAKALAMVTQPAGAVDNVAFTTQPAVRVVSATAANVAHPNLTITAQLIGAGGTLLGTTTAVTDANGIATFSNLRVDATTPPTAFTLRFSATFGGSALTTVDSSSFTVTATIAVTNFYNSSEAGGDGSDANILHADDFARTWGMKGDAEGYRSHPSTPGGLGDVQVFFPPADAAGNLQYTAGNHGSIFYRWPIPAVAADWQALGMDGILTKQITWGRGTQYGFCHGEMVGGTGGMSNYMVAHDFVRGVLKFWLRWDQWFPPDYDFGGEKVITINPPNWGGSGGIIWGGVGINIGAGAASSTGHLGFVLNGVDHLTGRDMPDINFPNLQRNHVYSLQLHLDRTGASGSHIVRFWADDLGTPGNITVPSGGTPTLRLNVTNETIIPVSGGHTQFGSCFKESWSNPNSACASPGSVYTNMMVWENNGPIPIRQS